MTAERAEPRWRTLSAANRHSRSKRPDYAARSTLAGFPKLRQLSEVGVVVAPKPRIKTIALELRTLNRAVALPLVPLVIRHRLEPQRRRDPVNGAVLLPSIVPAHQRIGIAIDRGQLAPRAAGAQAEHDGLDRRPVINSPPAGLPDSQERLDLSPCSVGQVRVTWHIGPVPARGFGAGLYAGFSRFGCMQRHTRDFSPSKRPREPVGAALHLQRDKCKSEEFVVALACSRACTLVRICGRISSARFAVAK